MPVPMSDAEIEAAVAAYKQFGSYRKAGAALGIHNTTVMSRVEAAKRPKPTKWAYPRTRGIDVENGNVIVYSDAHFWPGIEPTLSYRALLALTSVLRPAAVIANGDLSDFPKISHWARAGWARLPSVADELEEVVRKQAELKAAAGNAITLRSTGNHDKRLDAYLAQNADQFERVKGFRLSDHLEAWPESWSIRINDDVIVKHRYHGGVHANWNNVLKSGINVVTGDTHRLDVRSFHDYRGIRYGVETGMLAPHPQTVPEEGEGPAEFFEDNPALWCEGFAVLTFHKGRLLPPELCRVDNNIAWFRGTAVAQ